MNINHARPYTFDRVVRMIIGLTIIVVLALLINELRTVLLPFAIGWLLAYLFQPIVSFFQNKLKLKYRILAIVCTILVILIILAGIIWFLIPLIGKEIDKFSQLITLYTQSFTVDSFLPPAWQAKIREFFSHLDFKTILNDPSTKDFLKNLAPKLWGVVNSSLSFVLGLVVVVIVFLYFIFISLDYEKINAGFTYAIPSKYRPLAIEIITDMKTGMNKYFRGQALIALIDGILFAIGFYIMGLPMGIVLGLLMGLFNLVPYMQALGYLPAMLLGLLQSAETGQSYWSILLWILIIVLAVQVIEQVFLTPKIMGKATGLNPAIILLSLSVWGSLLGLLGMIIALPVTTLMISYYKRFVLNEEPLPTEEVVLETEQTEMQEEIPPEDVDL
ncbi:AI-2E family transporter [Paludibacter sp. 221]|uniref:AI-2E family transporter n=1 Tax=Paludibacter sp. 221 TaxID=2302939 RepID=UPI0013D60E8A|nr:AI-2E family transporter [Paludibacter sp. 221]